MRARWFSCSSPTTRAILPGLLLGPLPSLVVLLSLLRNMQPATFVVNNEGRQAHFCPLPGDSPGLYVLYFNQGATHGSRKITGDEPMLPMIFSPESLSDTMLQQQMLRHWQAHNAVVVRVDSSAKTRDNLVRAWDDDLRQIGGQLPNGKPNSRATGIQRSNGLPFGSFATKTRAHSELRRCWRLLAVVLGRDDPFPKPTGGASQPATASSFDGILYTKQTDNFKGLKPHQDAYPPPHGETGQLQALVYVHPTPSGVLRLGCAVAFYPAKDRSLWRDYLLSLVTRWSTSPDVDLRHSPLPGLGSKKGPGKHKIVLGGPRLDKKAAKKLTDAELQATAFNLPEPLRTLAKEASQLKTKTQKPAQFLKQWRSSASCLGKTYSKARLKVLKDLGDAKANRKNTPSNLIRSAHDCTTRAIRFGAPDKLHTWLLHGGRKRRAKTDILQPSGFATKAQKKTGSLSTFPASKKRRR